MKSLAFSNETNSFREKKKLLDVFSARSTQLSALDEKYWTIIGSGPIGAKAEELRNKTPAIIAAGFVPNPRIALAMGFFEEFRKRSGVDDALADGVASEELILQIRETPFSESELKTIRCLVKQFRKEFPRVPIIARSSAHGDCRGTGIYESEFCKHFRNEQKTIGALERAIKTVLASEFTHSAIVFRKDLKLPGGMAVIIEPVFGQFMESRYRYGEKKETVYGPYFSGIAYTSTAAGPGYAQFVAGLPTRVMIGSGFIARENDESKGEENDFFYQRGYLDSMWGDERRFCMDFGIIHGWRDGEWFKNGRLVIDKYVHGGCGIRAKTLFQKLRKLGHILGKPQYVEWAVRERIGCAPEFGILQIADTNPKSDYFELVESERTLITSNFVSGSGQLECNGVVGVFGPYDIYLLRRYNETHKGYAVIYRGRFLSRTWTMERLEYGDINNASALIEIADVTHVGSPKTHFGSAADMTGKLLMATRDLKQDRLKRYETVQKDGNNKLRIYPIKVRVTTSERRQKGIVELIE